jgi:AcrR family transcriptional regulator
VTARRPGRPPKAAAGQAPAPDAQAAIRRAALQLFARQGFEGCSVADIAREAQVAKPLIHYHHGSKEALWQAAVGEAFAALQGQLGLLALQLHQATPQEAFRQAAGALVRHAAAHPDLVRIVVQETARRGERGDWLLAQHLVPMYQMAAQGYEHWRRQGWVRPDAPPVAHLIPSVLGLMHFAFLEAEVVKQALAQDVFDEAYIAQQATLLHRWFQAMCLPLVDN